MQLRRLLGIVLAASAILYTGRVCAQPAFQANPDTELKTGADLTRQGMLQEAIPHLLAAQQSGANKYAAAFNLGICYLGTGRYKEAIGTLEGLRSAGEDTAGVDNLLAQAYIGDGQTQRAFETFQQAAIKTPKDEKLYAYMADACTDHQDYALGLQIVDQGLRQLPASARLHYERAVFLGRLDRFEEAKPDFERAAALAPGTYIAYLALVQESLYEDKYPEAVRLLREGVKAGNRDYRMLSLLGTVLMHEGASPGQPQFAEARDALEESAKDRPDYSATQIALGRLYAMEGRMSEAVEHLEIGRRLEPNNPEVYASLAHAYRRLGDRDKAQQCLVQLSRLLDEKKPSAPPSIH
jgi:tetratricopeptide (TPR) repeat protein